MLRTLLVSLLLISATAQADDVWVIGGIVTKPTDGFCTSLTLGATTTLHNPTDARSM